MNIMHITSRKAWIEATRAGQYKAPSLEKEGLIHCSTYSQILPVAEKYYKGQSDLVLLVIDPMRLTQALKWEPPAEGTPPPGIRAGEVFPHIYGPINLDAVIQILDLETGPDDRFALPPSLRIDR